MFAPLIAAAPGKAAAAPAAAPARRRSAVAATPALPASVREALGSPGRPLDAAGLAYFAPRYGRAAGLDLGRVRVHDDGLARRSAAEIGARAYAFGRHIVLGQGQPTARTLRHELAHVAQQPAAPGAPRRIAPADCPPEREAAHRSRATAAASPPAERVAAGDDPPRPRPGRAGALPERRGARQDRRDCPAGARRSGHIRSGRGCGGGDRPQRVPRRDEGARGRPASISGCPRRKRCATPRCS